jgi:hypothetical protein
VRFGPVIHFARFALALGALAFGAACSRPPLSVDHGAAAGAGGQASCPAPAGCNDDPAMSAIAGTCALNETTGKYTCLCAGGFKLNPETSRCRVSTTPICDQAAASGWPFGTRFDATKCASRPVTPCTPGDDVEAAVRLDLFENGCTLPYLTTIRVELADGCPALLEARTEMASLDQSFLTCAEGALRGLRLGCSSGADCVLAVNAPDGPIP